MSHAPTKPATSRWAPWWLYLVVLLGANYLRQLVWPPGLLPEWLVVVVVLAISAGLFILVTALHRGRAAGRAKRSAAR